MEYKKFLQGFSGFNSARVAMWATLLFVVLVAFIAVLNSGTP